MFTGIVEEVGTVRGARAGRFSVACAEVLPGTGVGDSLSVSGVCLTVTARDAGGFVADVMGETLARTTLGRLQPGDAVNLERPLRADGRLGGHLVQGHVDGVGTVLAVEDRGAWTEVTVGAPAGLGSYLVEKGSVAVDGVSLTVAGVDDDAFRVGLVPHTLSATVFGTRRTGDPVNLEADVVAKYVERLLGARTATPYRPATPRRPAD